MRVIFLDIDGVLNSEEYILKLEAKHKALGHEVDKRETRCECFKHDKQIDRDAVARVNRVVDETRAKIVISSSWRKLYDLPELRRLLSEHGLRGEVIDQTPDASDQSVREDISLEYGKAVEDGRIFRGHEIDYWLRYTGKGDVEGFVIFDDGSDMAMHGNRLVQTDAQDGLLDEHVPFALRVLAWDGKSQPPPSAEVDDVPWQGLGSKPWQGPRSKP